MNTLWIALIFGLNGVATAADKVDPAMPTDPLADEKAAVIGTIQENKKPVDLNAKPKKMKKKAKMGKGKAPAAADLSPELPTSKQKSEPEQPAAPMPK